MELRGKSILITGGAGFIGSHLAEKILLTKDPACVVVFDNFCASKHGNIEHLKPDSRFKLVTGDVRDFDVLEPWVEKCDMVFHLAASKLVVSAERPRLDLETNIIGVFNILQLARKHRKRVLYTSTGSVLGSSDIPMDEEHSCNPTTLYGISKLTAERYCQFFHLEYGLPVTVLRYFHVFGPRQDYSGDAGVVSIFISRVLKGQPPRVFGSGEQIRCFTFVEDDVDATLMLMERDDTIGEIYNVASRNRISVRQLADKVIQTYGPPGMQIQYGPARPGENLKPIPETGKIEKLGWRAGTSFEQGLEKTLQWIVDSQKKRPERL